MSIKSNKWKIIDIISWGDKYFNKKGFSNGRLEIEWFLCYLLNYNRVDLYLKFEQIITDEQLASFRSMIKRRLAGEPFQHIIGKGSFYGRDFIVNSDVLVPRPETELIINRLMKKDPSLHLMDIGTGSGCIAITCVLENLSKNVYATDISLNALKIAKQNAKLFGLSSIKFSQHDFLNQNFTRKFDVVVSNPPYIESNKMHKLPIEVRNHEPKIALTDNSDGLTFYRRFANIFFDLLKNDGYLILEIHGSEKIHEIKKIFNTAKLQVDFFKDLQNDYRIVEVFK